MNRGKCRLRLRKARWRGMLWFYCERASHDHGQPPHGFKYIKPEDIVVDPDWLYAEMVAQR